MGEARPGVRLRLAFSFRGGLICVSDGQGPG